MNIKFNRPIRAIGFLLLLLISLALTLAAAQADHQAVQVEENAGQVEDNGRYRKAFVFPLRLPVLVERSEATPLVSRLCDYIARSHSCPKSATEMVAGFSEIDDFTTDPPPHLRVSFILQEMENDVVSGDGVDIPSWAFWETTGLLASVEEGGPYALPAPGPDETWPVAFHNQIYDAIVKDGCGSTPLFPVHFDSWIEEGVVPAVQIGSFSAVDNSTLTPNGFWNFDYTIRATGTNGGVSDFRFKGIISITCTFDDEL